MPKLSKNKQGFTIIEVVLVLAIAGMIFLVVFMAIPQLQKNRRDNQRRNDAGRALAALETAAGTNNGKYLAASEASWTTLVNDFLAPAQFSDPADPDNNYKFSADNTPAQGEMAYLKGACNADGKTSNGGGLSGQIAIIVYQESGGSYCVDNN